jgi:hypothetical protein
VTLSQLLSKSEFWAALFGALAAFLLGALGQWWSTNTAKRTAGNLALIALGQMYTQIENLRHYYLEQEPIRMGDAKKLVGYKPLSIELRPPMGLPEQSIRVPIDSLGFLAVSHDADVLNRLLTVERAFHSILVLVRLHRQLHGQFTERLSTHNPMGDAAYRPDDLIPIVGAKLLIEIDDAVHGLKIGLPECCADLLAVGQQLRQTLCVELPIRRFVTLTPMARAGITTVPDNLPKPALWRRVTRWMVDMLRTLIHRRSRAQPAPKTDATPRSEPLEIRRFPPRSYGEPS